MAVAYAIIRRHVFADGNKRTGIEVLAMILELNGLTLIAPDDEVVTTAEGVASGAISAAEFLQWVLSRRLASPGGA